MGDLQVICISEPFALLCTLLNNTCRFKMECFHPKSYSMTLSLRRLILLNSEGNYFPVGSAIFFEGNKKFSHNSSSKSHVVHNTVITFPSFMLCCLKTSWPNIGHRILFAVELQA